MATSTTTGPAPDVTAPADRLPFTLGHGTENDFVLIADPDGTVHLRPAVVAALCERRAGLGADGLIRVVRSDACSDGADALAEDAAAHWFMDYRNADGSVAEMCGNGVRVFVRYLLEHGLVDPDLLTTPTGLPVGTRGGVKRVRAVTGPAGEADWLAVDMGHWRLTGGRAAHDTGHDSLVEVRGLDGVARPGLSLDLGNPHTVVALADAAELDAADLSTVPAVSPVPPHGTNVELVVIGPVTDDDGTDPTGEAAPTGRLRMRVHERGVGETRSCGTGACAAALAAVTWGGSDAPSRWLVDVPGGTLRVRLLADQRVELAGPAVLVASGVVELARLRP